MTDEFLEVLRRRRHISASLRATLARTQRISDEFHAVVSKNSNAHAPPLLVTAEGLIAAHKAAKIDDDGYTLDLIEDALLHVGKRLARECPEGRLRMGG